MTDEELLESAKRGDEVSFTALYRRYRDLLFAFAWRLEGSPRDAEDTVHECFVDLFGRDGFDPRRGSLRTYLYAAARNQVLKRMRRSLRELEAEDAEPPSACPAAEDQLAVEEAVRRLPHLQREALVLFEIDGLSLEEVAGAVGAPVGAVKARLHRARERLRRELAPVARKL